ncbi:uncharacterized protein SOCE26_103600 [Sorangium cellulosum]|uniref:Uncharacterized protein n=1 Tax=Sorangium cellulosum TaxID=56 RepID=A0A2L0FBL9_SORCE|nr:hypothetical protein [Sorangium cellulosum]AUX48819.1 uncharacterized protein SOCE26_103600 [Sorangium cellulosum]
MMNHGTILLVDDNKRDAALTLRAIFVELTKAIERLHVCWQMNEAAPPRRAS